MLWRGRATLAGLGLGVALGIWSLLTASSEPKPVEGSDAGTAELPDVAARGPAKDSAVPVAPVAALLPPVGREALERVDPATGRLEVERRVPPGRSDLVGPLEVQTTLDAGVTRWVWDVLERGRVELGHALVLDPTTRELRAYVSTAPERFPPTRSYPAASLVKVVTAAAALDVAPGVAEGAPCRYTGSPWRLTRARLDLQGRGRAVSLRRALATSNNQCFAQLGVHRIGGPALLEAIDRFGLLRSPGPGHPGGRAEDPGADALEVGKLASGLDGLAITPLHALGLAATLVDGRRAPVRWVDGVVDGEGRQLELPDPGPPVQVLTAALAGRIREMLADTTVRGTARKAFRTRRGRPLLQGISVAGKTGSLNGEDPDGRYEWFIGLAPAEQPRVLVATVAVQGPLYWMSASQMAAEILKGLFCPQGVCRVEALQGISRPSALARKP